MAGGNRRPPIGELKIDELPCTFANGIPCVYSRPGRALRGWLRWARHGFGQSRAVHLIREGLIAKPSQGKSIGFSRLANTLSRIPIGFQSDRYRTQILLAIRMAEERRREEAADSKQMPNRDFGLQALQAIWAMMQPLVELAPSSSDDAASVLTKAKRFLQECARVENQIDGVAQESLLSQIEGMLLGAERLSHATLDVAQWLENLPLESHIMRSGPQPGRVHVAPLALGGHSGRRHVYVVGLDDHFPKKSPVDPILLDHERKNLSEQLWTSQHISEEHSGSLDRCLFRVMVGSRAHISLSYSVRDLVRDRDGYPSPSMLELLRLSEQQEDLQMDVLQRRLGVPVAFASMDADAHLCTTDQYLASLLSQTDQETRERSLESRYEYVKHRRLALDAIASPHLTQHDGLVSTAGVELDPTKMESVSSSQLETYGRCPRKYFFRYGLGIRPPDEFMMDLDRWLDPMQHGSLLHRVFEQFLIELTEQGRAPQFPQDRLRLYELLAKEIDRVKTKIPIPNAGGYQRTRSELEESCDIFLSKEDEYCRRNETRPWIMEASIGLHEPARSTLDSGEPVAIHLSDGRSLRICGRIDRVDRHCADGSETYAIWDYKSGSSYGYEQSNPFQQGRKLQPFVYFRMLRHRIAAIGGKPEAVTSFGYFFPHPRAEGLRIQWTGKELQSGDDVVQSICDLMASGIAIPTTDADDCTYCEYQAVCGDVQFVAATALRKSKQDGSLALQPWRQLRSIDLDGGESS